MNLLPVTALVAFQKFYVHKDYPAMDAPQKIVMKTVFDHFDTPVEVHLKWYDGSTSIQTYIYDKRRINITSSNPATLFLPSFAVENMALSWLKKPEILLRWQLWPARIFKIKLLDDLIYSDDALLEEKEIPFQCKTSEIFNGSLELMQVVSSLKHQPFDEATVKNNFELFLHTIVWGIYQRTINKSIVLFVKQLFFYLRAVDIDWRLTSHFWLYLFSGQQHSLNCLAITSLLCAIMECFDYFPARFSARLIQGHAVLVYRLSLEKPWTDLELSVPNDPTLNWLGACEWVNYGQRSNFVVQSSQELVAMIAANIYAFEFSGMPMMVFGGNQMDSWLAFKKTAAQALQPFTEGDEKNVPQRLHINSVFQEQMGCLNELPEDKIAKFLQDFQQRPQEYLPVALLNVMLCRSVWQYIRDHCSEIEKRDIYKKLRAQEYLTSKTNLWQFSNPLARIVPSMPQITLRFWKNNISPGVLQLIQDKWKEVWQIEKEVMPPKLLGKRRQREE